MNEPPAHAGYEPPHMHHGSPPPGWAVPILVGAASALLVQGALGVLANSDQGCFLCCCAPVVALPYGFLPAFIAQRRDPTLTPGQGLAIAAIATGIGTVAWAIVIAATTDSSAIEKFESVVREALVEVERTAPPGQKLSPEDRDRVIAALVGVYPYLPVIQAAVLSLMAGVVGLLTVLIFRPRRRAPAPPQQHRDDSYLQQ